MGNRDNIWWVLKKTKSAALRRKSGWRETSGHVVRLNCFSVALQHRVNKHPYYLVEVRGTRQSWNYKAAPCHQHSPNTAITKQLRNTKYRVTFNRPYLTLLISELFDVNLRRALQEPTCHAGPTELCVPNSATSFRAACCQQTASVWRRQDTSSECTQRQNRLVVMGWLLAIALCQSSQCFAVFAPPWEVTA